MKWQLSSASLGALAGAWAGLIVGCASAPAPTQQIVVHDASGFQDAIAAVADAALPCVVHIDVSGTALKQVPTIGPFGGFSDMPQGISKVPMRALGSGILITAEGDILTNNHVVEDADSITVHFYDGTSRPARVIGSDPFTDVAVIKVEGVGSSRVARLGDSDSLRVGEWVVAIGSPRGLDWTVTAGIVSATHRVSIGTGPAGLEDYIQTDTAINPGNSGGPLLNLRGEVIGMNSLILSQSQGSEGLGFAIPTRIMRTIAETLIAKGTITRGDLGMDVQDLDESISATLKLPLGMRGVVVTEAFPLGPAADASITAGDVITSFQQTPITTTAQLNRLVADTVPGGQVTLGLVRGGAVLRVPVTVADQLDLARKKAARPGYALLGIRVDPVSASLAGSIGLNKPIGVLVVEVVPGSPADSVGIGNGDIIFKVDGEDVNDKDQFRQHVGEAIKAGRIVVLLRDAQSGAPATWRYPSAEGRRFREDASSD